MKIFLLLCHPKRDSLFGTVADAFAKGALEAEHNLKKSVMLTLPAHTEDKLKKRKYHDAITKALNIWIFNYNKFTIVRLYFQEGLTVAGSIILSI